MTEEKKKELQQKAMENRQPNPSAICPPANEEWIEEHANYLRTLAFDPRAFRSAYSFYDVPYSDEEAKAFRASYAYRTEVEDLDELVFEVTDMVSLAGNLKKVDMDSEDVRPDIKIQQVACWLHAFATRYALRNGWIPPQQVPETFPYPLGNKKTEE